jgi:SAM-dependent methyltransferase
MADDPFYRSAADYDLRYSYGSNIDVAFWSRLRARLGARRVLELACGSGRVTLPLARAGLAEGVQVVGLELAPAMLAGARAKLAAEPAAVQAAVRLVEGDMRAFALPERFDLIAVPFNSLAHLHTIDDQVACFESARRHLAPGGRFAVEVMQPRIEELYQTVTEPEKWYVDGGATDLVTGDRLVRHRRRRYQRDTQTAESHYIEERLTPSGELKSQTVDLRQHIYSPRELELLFRLTGFRVEAIYGDYEFGPFTEESEYLIVVGAAVEEAAPTPRRAPEMPRLM